MERGPGAVPLSCPRRLRQAGYIVMTDFATGVTSELLRFEKASVVAIAKELLTSQLVAEVHGYTKVKPWKLRNHP